MSATAINVAPNKLGVGWGVGEVGGGVGGGTV